jgi:hypothetical protein
MENPGLVPKMYWSWPWIMQPRETQDLAGHLRPMRISADPLVDAGNRRGLCHILFGEGCTSWVGPEVVTSIRKPFRHVSQDQELFGVH